MALSTTAPGAARLSNPAGHWIHIDRTIEGATQAQSGARRAFSVYSKRNWHFPLLANLFPFAVYNLPRVLRASPDDVNDWRKMRVHGGRVMGSDAANTDNVNFDSAPEQMGSFLSAQETWLPNTNGQFYFWLEYGMNATNGVQARVLFGIDPGVGSYSDAGSTPNYPWDHSSAPWNTIGNWSTWNVNGDMVPDGNHLPIANITISNAANGSYSVRQYLRSDWLLPPAVPFHYKDYANNCQNMIINVVAFGPASNSST